MRLNFSQFKLTPEYELLTEGCYSNCCIKPNIDKRRILLYVGNNRVGDNHVKVLNIDAFFKEFHIEGYKYIDIPTNSSFLHWMEQRKDVSTAIFIL